MELIRFIFSSFWIFVGFFIILSLIVTLISNILTNIFKAIVIKSKKYTKQDLKEAWLHGELRTPKEYEHCNNFDVYFNNKYKTK